MRATKQYSAIIAEYGTVAVAQSRYLPAERFANNECMGTSHVCSPHDACAAAAFVEVT